MNRKLISFEALLSAAAQGAGYTPYYCSTPSLMPKVQRMPVAVIYPSVMIEKVGIVRCRITTKMEFLLAKSGISLSQEQKMQLDDLQVRATVSVVSNFTHTSMTEGEE